MRGFRKANPVLTENRLSEGNLGNLVPSTDKPPTDSPRLSRTSPPTDRLRGFRGSMPLTDQDSMFRGQLGQPSIIDRFFPTRFPRLFSIRAMPSYPKWQPRMAAPVAKRVIGVASDQPSVTWRTRDKGHGSFRQLPPTKGISVILYPEGYFRHFLTRDILSEGHWAT